jgi:hypothetical protein
MIIAVGKSRTAPERGRVADQALEFVNAPDLFNLLRLVLSHTAALRKPGQLNED